MTKYILTIAEGAPCYGGDMDDSGPVRMFDVDSPEDAARQHLSGFGPLQEMSDGGFVAFRKNLNGGTTGIATMIPVKSSMAPHPHGEN